MGEDYSQLEHGEDFPKRQQEKKKKKKSFLRLSPAYRGAWMKQQVSDGYTRACLRLGCGSHLPLITYILVQLGEQLRAVIPISLYLVLFRLLVFHRGIDDAGLVVMGLVLLIIGLALFMEGLKLALVPLGELLGSQLPKKIPLWGVLAIAFILGISVTLAEPAIGVLGTLSTMIEPTRAPYLFLLLGQWNLLLMLFVGLGVGIAAVVGILRFTKGWSLKPIIFITCTLTTALTCYINWVDERLRTVVGLAWDCGAVTTGPVTVPIILSIGIGVIAHKRSIDPSGELSPLSGFGIVTLASLYPIIAVEILALVSSWIYPGDAILEVIGAGNGTHNGTTGGEAPVEQDWYDVSPVRELIFALRAIAPLVVLLLFILKVILREKLPRVILFAEATVVNGDASQPAASTGRSITREISKAEVYVATELEISVRHPGKDLEAYALRTSGDLDLTRATPKGSKSYLKLENRAEEEDEEAGDVELKEKRHSGDGEEDHETQPLNPVAATGQEGKRDTRRPADKDEEEQQNPHEGEEVLTLEDPHEHDLAVASDSNLLSERSSSTFQGWPGALQDLEEVGRFSRSRVFVVGVVCAQLGMILFNWGLTYGLSALGTSAGNILPGAFEELPSEEGTPVFGREIGLAVVFAFGWILGFLATIAEPALNILGEKVSNLTGGAFSKNLLIYSVSFGVATGIVLGLVKIVFEEVQLVYLILGGYAIALVLTFFSSEDFVNVAWDSAGVTTGPVTVPFVLTLGLSLGKAVNATDGFGILTMASVGPIISVLSCGLWIRLWAKIKGPRQ